MSDVKAPERIWAKLTVVEVARQRREADHAAQRDKDGGRAGANVTLPRAAHINQRDEPRARDHRPIAALSRQRRRVIGPRLTGAVTERIMADRGRAA